MSTITHDQLLSIARSVSQDFFLDAIVYGEFPVPKDEALHVTYEASQRAGQKLQHVLMVDFSESAMITRMGAAMWIREHAYEEFMEWEKDFSLEEAAAGTDEEAERAADDYRAWRAARDLIESCNP